MLVNFPERHIIHVPSTVSIILPRACCRPAPAPPQGVSRCPLPALLQSYVPRNYSRFDEDLARWHADLVEVYDSAASMAVVGQLSSDLGLEFHFHRQAGAERRGEGLQPPAACWPAAAWSVDPHKQLLRRRRAGTAGTPTAGSLAPLAAGWPQR